MFSSPLNIRFAIDLEFWYICVLASPQTVVVNWQN